MKLPVMPPLPPMEAIQAPAIPEGDGWQYEPKWDGFRCLAFRDGEAVELQSKACKTLARYFPEVVAAVREVGAPRFVLDGELAIPVRGRFSFDDLLLRIHPAESRVVKLSRERPAIYIVFDILVDGDGESLIGQPLEARRARLEKFAALHLPSGGSIRLSPASRDLGEARKWFRGAGGNLDGVIAKRLDAVYRAGERDAVRKVKKIRTADCVVGGFRYATKEPIVGSLLLGLYDAQGNLHHVGYTSSLTRSERQRITPDLKKRVHSPGFTGAAPGGPSRWSAGRESSDWEPLAPELVAEVEYDHFTGGRFRHGTRFLRWRPDKAPKQCTFVQVTAGRGTPLSILE